MDGVHQVVLDRVSTLVNANCVDQKLFQGHALRQDHVLVGQAQHPVGNVFESRQMLAEGAF